MMTQEECLITFARAVVSRDESAALELIEAGLPLSGLRISANIPADVPRQWLADGLAPLAWVVLEMLRCGREGGCQFNGMSFPSLGIQGEMRAKVYSAGQEQTLGVLSKIGGALLMAGANSDVRLGRTARSQKALEALSLQLPEYEKGLRSAANQRKLEALIKHDPERKVITGYDRKM